MIPCDIIIKQRIAEVLTSEHYPVFKSHIEINEKERDPILKMIGDDPTPDGYVMRSTPELMRDIGRFHNGIIPNLISINNPSKGEILSLKQPCYAKLIPKKEWSDENGCFVCLIEIVEKE